MEFTLKEIIELLYKRIKLIAVCTAAGLCIAFVISSYITRPTYTATVQMYVNPADAETAHNINELNYAQKVVATYINFLRTKVFYQQVIEKSNLAYSPGQLKQMTDIHSVNNSELFQISVTTYSPEDSFMLVETMQNLVPEFINNIKATAKISIVDPVVMPTAPSGPNIMRNTMVGGMIGFIFSTIISILWELIDTNVKSQEDLAKKYNIPLLGSIPDFNTDTKKKLKKYKLLALNKFRKTESKLHSSINISNNFTVTEAYKALRTNLRFALWGSSCKKIIISSPTPDDGKSTTSANLAITIAQTGAKVLLMDCDLRKGRLHRIFKIKNVRGVTNALSNMVNEMDAIYKTTYENVDLMPMGTLAPNPTELLAGSQMEELIKKLEKLYDYIIIDTPPVNVVSDVLSMTKLVDGIMLVVKENKTSHPDISVAINKLKFVEANILGFVMNGVMMNRSRKYKYSYQYYYGNNNEKHNQT